MTRAGVVASPNIWRHPAVYELENRAVDPDGVIEAAMRSVRDWRGAHRAATSAAAAATTCRGSPRDAAASSASSRTRRSSSWRAGGRPGWRRSTSGPGRRSGCRCRTPRSTSRTRAGPTSSAPAASRGCASCDRVVRRGGAAFVIDNDATRSTFGGWFRRELPGTTRGRSSGSGPGRGWSRTPLTIRCGLPHAGRPRRHRADRVLAPARRADPRLAPRHRGRLRGQPLLAHLLTPPDRLTA